MGYADCVDALAALLEHFGELGPVDDDAVNDPEEQGQVDHGDNPADDFFDGGAAALFPGFAIGDPPFGLFISLFQPPGFGLFLLFGQVIFFLAEDLFAAFGNAPAVLVATFGLGAFNPALFLKLFLFAGFEFTGNFVSRICRLTAITLTPVIMATTALATFVTVTWRFCCVLVSAFVAHARPFLAD